MKIDQALSERFVCIKCGSRGGSVKRFAATGTGLSRMLDIEHNVFIAVSCGACGYTELYNPEIIEDQEDLGVWLDTLFGS